MSASRAFYRAFTDPASEVRDMTQEARIDSYSRAWAYYRGTMWGSGYNWTVELATRRLYKHTRMIYKPVGPICDFYIDNLWQPADNEDFESLVTPLSDKTDETIVAAVAQLDQWGNFRSESQKMKRYAAVTGNVLIEGIDDPIRGKILHKIIWPGYVTAIELNDTGDVLGYTLEYPVYDPAKKGTYQYKKIVTKDTYSYFRDDRPFVPEGKTAAVEANSFGFVFAIWVRHMDDGGSHGLPACPNFDKVDNVNSLASHIDDFIHKAIESPKVISVDGEIVPLIGATRNSDGSLTDQDPALNWMVLKTKMGTTVHDLLGLLDLAAVSPELDRQLKSFENDFPELQASSIIRENSQLSGAALERMLGPAQNRLDGVQGNYNQQLIKFRQMGIAVAGMRTRNGWTRMTDQQRLFADFNLESYGKGDLDFNLKRSVLVQNTETENEELLKVKADRAVTLQPFIDRKEALSIAGFTDEQIEDMGEPEAVTPPPVVPGGLPENRQLEAVNA